MASRFPSEENVQIRSKLESSETSTSNHLQSVSENVNAAHVRKMNRVNYQERNEIRLINEKADEEIRIINEKRDKLIKAWKEEAEEQRQTLKDSTAKLLSDIKTINEKVKKKINELKSKHHHYTDIVDNVDSKIERMKQDDKVLVQEAPQVIASLDESLCSNVRQEVADYLDQIEREVQRVKFVEGEVGGKYYGRIDGYYIGKWQLFKSINIPWTVREPRVRGLISDDEICVLDDSSKALYVTNISTEHTEKVIAGDRNMYVTSCVPVGSNVLVCGKRRKDCTGGKLDDCITLYDRQWEVIRDITMPYAPLNEVSVGVDRDGMILAAPLWQSDIYVINPADGKIVSTITMEGRKLREGIQALSSGDIVVQADDFKFTVVSRSGEEKVVIRCDEWFTPECDVDKLADTLYITYWDSILDMYFVDQVSRDGNIQARRIVEYKESYRYPFISPCLVTPSGNLVVCDGDKLLVYRKSFIV